MKSDTVRRVLLPPDAKRTFIRDIARVNPRNSRVPDDVAVSFVAMADVSEHGELIKRTSAIRGDLGNGYTQFVEGDILVAKITPCFENGKGALAQGLDNKIGFGTTEFHVIRPNDPADAGYLHQITLTQSFRRAGERQMSGSAGQRRVPPEFLEDFPISVLDEKARRAAGTLLAAFDVELSYLEKSLTALRAQKDALMQKLLSGEVNVTERFEHDAYMGRSGDRA